MVFTIFIGGLLEFNSGKTTVAKEIITFFENEKSIITTPFKPLSGTNLFFNSPQIEEHVQKHSHFVSLDILDLLSCSSNDVSPILVNPVHRVNTQAFPFYFSEEGTLNTFFSRFSGSVSLLQRFTTYSGGEELKNTYILDESIYSNQKFWTNRTLVDSVIIESNCQLKKYRSEHEYYALNSQYYANAVQSCYDYLKTNSNIIIIERYNDSAHPAWCIRDSDIVVLVGPGTMFVYEPQSYFRAIDNYRSINRNKPTTTDEIVKLTKPTKSIFLSGNPLKQKEEIKQLCQDIYPKIETN